MPLLLVCNNIRICHDKAHLVCVFVIGPLYRLIFAFAIGMQQHKDLS